MKVMGMDAGTCIHCFKLDGVSLCSLENNTRCDEKNSDHCLNYSLRVSLGKRGQ